MADQEKHKEELKDQVETPALDEGRKAELDEINFFRTGEGQEEPLETPSAPTEEPAAKEEEPAPKAEEGKSEPQETTPAAEPQPAPAATLPPEVSKALETIASHQAAQIKQQQVEAAEAAKPKAPELKLTETPDMTEDEINAIIEGDPKKVAKALKSYQDRNNRINAENNIKMMEYINSQTVAPLQKQVEQVNTFTQAQQEEQVRAHVEKTFIDNYPDLKDYTDIATQVGEDLLNRNPDFVLTQENLPDFLKVVADTTKPHVDQLKQRFGAQSSSAQGTENSGTTEQAAVKADTQSTPPNVETQSKQNSVPAKDIQPTARTGKPTKTKLATKHPDAADIDLVLNGPDEGLEDPMFL